MRRCVVSDIRFKIQQLDAGAAHWLGWAKKEVRRLAAAMPAFTRTWQHGDVTVRAQYHEESGIARLWLTAAGYDWVQEARFQLPSSVVVFARSDIVLTRSIVPPHNMTLLWRDSNGVWGGKGRDEGLPTTAGDTLPFVLPAVFLYNWPIYVSDDATRIVYYGYVRLTENRPVVILHTAQWDGTAWQVTTDVEEEIYFASYSNLVYQLDEARQSGISCMRTGLDAITTYVYAQGDRTARAEVPVGIVTPLYDYADVGVAAFGKARALFTTYTRNGEPSSYVNEIRWMIEEQLPDGTTSVLNERVKGNYYSSYSNGVSINPTYYVYNSTYAAAGGARTVFVYDDDKKYDLQMPSHTYINMRTVAFKVLSCVSGAWAEVMSHTGAGVNADPANGGYPFNIVKAFQYGYHGGLFIMHESNGNETEHSGSTYTYSQKYTCYCYVEGEWKSAVLYEGVGGAPAAYYISAGLRNQERGTSDYTFTYRAFSVTSPPLFGGDHDAALASWVGGALQQVTTFKWEINNYIEYQNVISRDGRTAFLWTSGGEKQLWSCALGAWKQVFSQQLTVQNYSYVRVSNDGKTVLFQHDGGVACWSCVSGSWIEVNTPTAYVGFISADGKECCVFSDSTPIVMQTIKFMAGALQEETDEVVQAETAGPRTTYYIQRDGARIVVAKRRVQTVAGSSMTGRFSDSLFLNTNVAMTALNDSSSAGLFAGDASPGFGQSLQLKQSPADTPDGTMQEVRYIPSEVVGGRTYPERLVLLYESAVRIFKRVRASSTL